MKKEDKVIRPIIKIQQEQKEREARLIKEAEERVARQVKERAEREKEIYLMEYKLQQAKSWEIIEDRITDLNLGSHNTQMRISDDNMYLVEIEYFHEFGPECEV